MHGELIAPNTLARQFAVDAIPGCDRVWASDITYVATREGWLYLAVVLDLASRRVIGWAVRETLEREIVLAALTMAVTHRQPAAGRAGPLRPGQSAPVADWRTYAQMALTESAFLRRRKMAYCGSRFL